MAKVYIFGYLSLLNGTSFNNTAGNKDSKKSEALPSVCAKLSGWRRDWSAVQHGKTNFFKIYADPSRLEIFEDFCWANIYQKKGGFVNGLLKEVEFNSLSNLDVREVGYERINVTNEISLYDDGLNEDDVVYTYIHKPEVENNKLAFIDLNYINMGTIGAKCIDESYQPGFFKDFIESTDACDAVISDMIQFFISYDGEKLYLLDSKDSSVCLIHIFVNHLYEKKGDIDPYFELPISEKWNCRDIRNVKSGSSKTLSIALTEKDEDRLFDLIEMDEIWVDMMLIRNPNLNEKMRNIVIHRGIWLVKFIAFDLGFIEDSGFFWQEKLALLN
jgi:hypothetical protein